MPKEVFACATLYEAEVHDGTRGKHESIFVEETQMY